MEPSQWMALVLGSSVVSGVAVKAIDWWRDARAGRMKARRDEVDKATQAKDLETKRADEAEAAEEDRSRRVRILEEALAVTRRQIIDAPCLGPGALLPYPSRKD